MSEVQELLERTKEVLAERGWSQGGLSNYRGPTGSQRPGDQVGTCCLVGALNAAYNVDTDSVFFPENGDRTYWAAQGLIRGAGKMKDSIAYWNDAPDRTLDEVNAVLDKAIEAADGFW